MIVTPNPGHIVTTGRSCGASQFGGLPDKLPLTGRVRGTEVQAPTATPALRGPARPPFWGSPWVQWPRPARQTCWTWCAAPSRKPANNVPMFQRMEEDGDRGDDVG